MSICSLGYLAYGKNQCVVPCNSLMNEAVFYPNDTAKSTCYSLLLVAGVLQKPLRSLFIKKSGHLGILVQINLLLAYDFIEKNGVC